MVVALEVLGGLAGAFPPCSELVPGPFSGANLGVSQSLQVGLDLAPASTSGDQTQVLLV